MCKANADRFMQEVQVDKTRGVWLDPRDADTSVEAWAEQFLSLYRRLSPYRRWRRTDEISPSMSCRALATTVSGSWRST